MSKFSIGGRQEIVSPLSSGFLKGYGCDSIDNDNNGEVDQCGEDTFGPTIDSSAAFTSSRGTWFSKEADVLAFMSRATITEDDCGLASLTNVTLLPACDASTVTLVALDRCQNKAIAEVPVLFDDRAPEVTIQLKTTVIPSK